MSPCRLFSVHGKVQGVWFRESTREQALQLGITGHAVNLPDGSVEVLACGTVKALAVLAAWLERGPPMASVSQLESREFDGACPGRFTTGWSRSGG
jgi:acylphosphatase